MGLILYPKGRLCAQIYALAIDNLRKSIDNTRSLVM